MGWQTSVFTLLIVEAGQPGTGLFVYNGAPGPGNPPIFWASGAATDLFGNALPGTAGVEGSGTFVVGTAPNTQLQLASNGGVGVLQFLLNSALFANGLLESAILSGFAQVLLNGPNAVAAGHTDFVGTEYNSSDGMHSANWTLIYNDASGTAHATAFGDWTGFNIPAGSIRAVAPGTGTSAVNAAVPESWHAPALPGGWGGGAAYRLYPDATVGLAGLITLPATGAYNSVVLFTLPAAYTPPGTKRLPLVSLAQSAAYGNNAASIGLPRIFIDSTTGNVSLAGLPAGINGGQVCLDGARFPIDI
jgi:hypothetical protein